MIDSFCLVYLFHSFKVFTMATKMVVQQPKALVVSATSDQWSTSICECEGVNECKYGRCMPAFDINSYLNYIVTYSFIALH